MREASRNKHITLHKIENEERKIKMGQDKDLESIRNGYGLSNSSIGVATEPGCLRPGIRKDTFLDIVNENEAMRQALHIEGRGGPIDTRVYLFGLPITEVCDRIADYEKMKLKLKKAEDAIHQWEEYTTYLLIHGFTDLPERYEI